MEELQGGGIFLLSVQLCKGGREERAKMGVENLTASLGWFSASGKQALEFNRHHTPALPYRGEGVHNSHHGV